MKNTKGIILVLLTLYAAPAFADCLQLPLVNHGTAEKGDWDVAIPSGLPKTYVIADGMPAANGQPKFTDTYVCFDDLVKIPVKLSPISREQTSGLVEKRIGRGPVPSSLEPPKKRSSFEQFLERSIRTVWRYIGPALAWATTSTDNFNRADNTDMGAAWDPYSDQMQISGNQATGFTDSVVGTEGYNTYIPGANQYTQFTLRTNSWVGFIRAQAYVRLQAPTTHSGYICVVQPSDQGTRTRVRRVDAGNNFTLGSENTVDWADGDIVRLEVTGTSTASLNCKRNGATLATGADGAGTYTSGRGGLGIQTDVAFNLGASAADDFEVGDLAGGAAVVRHRPIVIQ